MNRQAVAEELLHETVLRLWSGSRRSWDPDKGSLLQFLTWEMKSLVSNAASSPENRTGSLDEPVADSLESKGARISDDSPSIEMVHIEEEQARQLEAAIIEAAGDDAVLLKYIEAIMDGAGSPAEVAKLSGLTVEAVYQAHRKLVRRVKARQAKETAS
jgi:RNA polymerase sigma factor (sigma-70 family)